MTQAFKDLVQIGITLTSQKDLGTLLERILTSEEEHLDWLETQLGLVATLGEVDYLAQQLRE